MNGKRWLIAAALFVATFALLFPATQPAYPHKADPLFRISLAGAVSLVLWAGPLWLLSRGPLRRK